jgi:hypothetical protein
MMSIPANLSLFPQTLEYELLSKYRSIGQYQPYLRFNHYLDFIP